MIQKVEKNCIMQAFRRYAGLVNDEIKYKTRFMPVLCVECLDNANLDGL